MSIRRPHPLPIKPISLRNLLIILYLGALIPLLVVIGLVVYRLQQNFLLADLRARLTQFVEADVAAMSGSSDLTRLAVALGDDLRVLGADVFVKNAVGDPVPPALGTGPWLTSEQHRTAREGRTGSILTISAAGTDRLVYIVPVIESDGSVLGTVEASLPLETVQIELAGLRRWLILILSGAAGLSVLLALGISWMATRPLQHLVEDASRVSEGNLNHRANLPSVSEVRLIAVTFNGMLDRIQAALTRQARTADEMRRFAADASHELRSPLAVMRGGVEMLGKAEERGDYTQAAGILQILNGEIAGMSQLVENLLFLARLDQASAGSADSLKQETIEPLPFLEEICERAEILAKGQRLRLDWPTQTFAPIRADREMLRRALNNLVENAIKYTPSGKEIRLGLENSPAGCAFVIRDQGLGIPADVLPRIFERFYRVDSARSRQMPGTGLGLAIVQAIVEANGGRVSAESTEGVGTTMRLVIPYAEEP